VIGVIAVAVVVVGGVAVYVCSSSATLTGAIEAITTTVAGAQIHVDHSHSRNVQHGGTCYVNMSYTPPVYMGPTGGGLPPGGHYEWSDSYDHRTHAPHPPLAVWQHYDGYHEAPQGW